jgi:hypothetical protein
MILEVARAVKSNDSVLGIHLSGNPGLTEETISKLTYRLQLKTDKRFQLSSFNKVLSRRSPSPRNHKEEPEFLEAIRLKNIAKAKRLAVSRNVNELNDLQNRHFIITRTSGHQFDIPGSL